MIAMPNPTSATNRTGKRKRSRRHTKASETSSSAVLITCAKPPRWEPANATLPGVRIKPDRVSLHFEAMDLCMDSRALRLSGLTTGRQSSYGSNGSAVVIVVIVREPPAQRRLRGPGVVIAKCGDKYPALPAD